MVLENKDLKKFTAKHYSGKCFKKLLVVVLALLVLSSCSSSGNPTLSKTQEIAIIKARWAEAFKTLYADASASTSGVADVAGLSNYFAQGGYSIVVKNMDKIALANVVEKGKVQMGNNPQIIFINNSSVNVISCGSDSGWFENRITKQPELGTSPGTLKSKSITTMKDINGTWKIILVKAVESNDVC